MRRPEDARDFSGRVVVEIINMSAGYDWTAIWGAVTPTYTSPCSKICSHNEQAERHSRDAQVRR